MVGRAPSADRALPDVPERGLERVYGRFPPPPGGSREVPGPAEEFHVKMRTVYKMGASRRLILCAPVHGFKRAILTGEAETPGQLSPRSATPGRSEKTGPGVAISLMNFHQSCL